MEKVFPILLVAFAALASGCTKEGPEGPQGPAGTSNVRSTTITIEPGDWIQNGTFGYAGYGFIVDRPVPIITGEIANNGTVLVYLNVAGVWYALPYSFHYASWTSTYSYGYYPDRIHIELHDSDLHTRLPNEAQQYKIVAITGS